MSKRWFKPKCFKLPKKNWWWHKPKVWRRQSTVDDADRDGCVFYDAYPDLPGDYSQVLLTETGFYQIPKPTYSMAENGDLEMDFGTYNTLRETYLIELYTFDHTGRCIGCVPIDETFPKNHPCAFYWALESPKTVYSMDQMVGMLCDTIAGIKR